MPRKEIETVIELARQYLKPNYNVKGLVNEQQEQEEGAFGQVIAVIAKRDQDVLKIWNVVKKAKHGGKTRTKTDKN